LFCASSYDYSGYGYCNTAASSFNDDISAWDTSGVTTMSDMFFGASAFDQPIGDWSVDKVTDMQQMFYGASAFDQPLGDWNVDSVTIMAYMFEYAAAFDQDLGWCVDDGVSLTEAFENTQCESTSCGVTQAPGGCAPSPAPTTSLAPTATLAPTVTPLVADDSTIRTAVTAWFDDRSGAEATYAALHLRMEAKDQSGDSNISEERPRGANVATASLGGGKKTILAVGPGLVLVGVALGGWRGRRRQGG